MNTDWYKEWLLVVEHNQKLLEMMRERSRNERYWALEAARLQKLCEEHGIQWRSNSVYDSVMGKPEKEKEEPKKGITRDLASDWKLVGLTPEHEIGELPEDMTLRDAFEEIQRTEDESEK